MAHIIAPVEEVAVRLRQSDSPSRDLDIVEHTHLGRVVFLVGTSSAVLEDAELSNALRAFGNSVLAARAIRKVIVRGLDDGDLLEALAIRSVDEGLCTIGAMKELVVDDSYDASRVALKDVQRGLRWIIKRIPEHLLPDVKRLAARHL
jgi:hypothetical protein